MKASNYKTGPTAIVQWQLISCPEEFVKKHNLDENLSPLGKYAEEELFESGGCETLMLLGKDLLHLHPIVVDKYEAEGSHDNISNWVMLLKNLMYPEMILVARDWKYQHI